jgi:hypothetical protein
MSTVAFLHSLPFAGDELQTIKNNYGTYDELIMQLTEGVERNRMKYDKNLPNRYWHCAFISTGEEPITADNSGGGTKNRVIEVEINNKFFGRQGNAIVGFVSNNYGTAGAKFIEHIQNDNVDLKSMYQTINGEILNSVDTTDKQALAASLILLADKLACECLFKDDAPLSVSDLAPFIKSTEETDVAVRAYDWFNSWSSTNKSKFYENQYGEQWGRFSRDGNSLYVDYNTLQSSMKKANFTFSAVRKKWADNGWIKMHGKSYTVISSVKGEKNRCVEFLIES